MRRRSLGVTPRRRTPIHQVMVSVAPGLAVLLVAFLLGVWTHGLFAMHVFYYFGLAASGAVVLAVIVGHTGLNHAWWTPIARLLHRSEPPSWLRASADQLWTLAYLAATVPVYLVGIGWGAIAASGGWSSQYAIAEVTPSLVAASIGIPAALIATIAVAWFHGRSTAWLRAVPLIIVSVGLLRLTDHSPERFIGPVWEAPTTVVGLAGLVAWTVVVACASPARLAPPTPTRGSRIRHPTLMGV